MAYIRNQPPFIRTLLQAQDYLISLALGLLFYGIYHAATAPSVATIFDDSLEFPLVVHRLAIAHPTGYPLYTLLGKLFSLIDPTNIAYQLNLMSAFFGAVTVALVYAAALALSQVKQNQAPTAAQRSGAAVGAAIFGLGPVFFSQATIAEVYTLNAFFLALVLWLSLRQHWILLAWCIGLSLTHHRTMLLVLPAVLLYAWLHNIQVKLSRRELGLMMAGLLLPQLLYLYLPLRGHIGSLDGSYQHTWAGFFSYVLGGGYGSTFLGGNPLGQERDLWFYGRLIWQEIGWLGLIFGVLGLISLVRRQRWSRLALTGGGLLTFLVFNVSYRVGDIEVFFIPVFLVLALWAGLGLALILTWPWLRNPLIRVPVVLVMLVGLFVQQANPSRANDWQVHDYGRDILHQPLPPQATIIGILGEMTLVRYFQETANLRPDVVTIAADRDSDRLQQVAQHLQNQPEQAVYLTRPLAGAEKRWSLSALGPLIQVHPTPQMVRPDPDSTIEIQQEVTMSLTDEIQLVHYAISRPESHQPRDPLRLTLTWQALAPIEANYKISARLIDAQNQVLASIDKSPVHFAYPTSAWRAGEYITDVYDLPLPGGEISGNYSPILILYDPANAAAEVGRIVLPQTFVQ